MTNRPRDAVATSITALYACRMKTADRKATADPIALPPVIYGGFLVAGFVVDYFIPVSILPDRLQYPLGIAVMLASGAIMPFVLIRFRRDRTSFDGRQPTSSIITDGPFRYSRNPSYVALTMLCIGVGILADNVWVIGFTIPAVAVTHYGVILREERYLESRFGDEYLRYKASVRRWL